MKSFVFLFAVNVCVAIVLWLDVRQVRSVPVFEFSPSAKEVHLLNAGSGSRACILLGPIESAKRSESLYLELSARDYKVDLISQELERAPGYWVYYGPLDSYANALDQLKKFKAKKIDSFIITRDDLYGAISLGVFENIDSAQRMQVRMGERGYATSIRNIFKFKTVNWLQIERPQNADEYNKIKDLVRPSLGGLKTREIFCKTVASRKPLP